MRARRWPAAALFAVSALLHVAALVVLLGLLAPRPGQDTATAATDVVWIRTPPARPVSVPAPVSATPRPPPRRTRPAALAASRAAIAADAPPIAAAAPPDAPAAPVFDRQAALAAARKLASEPDPARAGTVGAQLDARRVAAETEDDKMGRTIASGKRTDCIKANGGGSLLTPLMWLLEKKGSGCKW